MLVCVNFGDEILLGGGGGGGGGGECKNRVNLNFFEKWKKDKLPLQYGLQT